jgi:hypothetical protein
MFKCDGCDASAPRPRRVVVARKMVTHLTEPRGPHGGVGSQIVHEMNLCEFCAQTKIDVLVPLQNSTKATLPPAPSGEYLTYDQIAEIAGCHRG